jgi:signal peptidase
MRIIDILIIIISILVVLPILLTLIPTGQMHFMIVSGNSMEPTISKDDIVLVVPIDYNDIDIGDIISYKYILEEGQQIIITHRVVYFNEQGFRTQGDAYLEQDKYTVPPEDVIGIMKLKIPYVGFLVHFARTTKGIMLMVILPAILLIIDEAKGMIKGV